MMTNNNEEITTSDGFQKRGELRRSSAMNYHQVKVKCANISQRPMTISYELSEDLRDKEIELTEKRYQGKFKSHRSARLIQRYYREYRLRSDYKRLKSEKRASRKLDLPALSYNNSTFKSPTSPNSPITIIGIITADVKKQSSYEDLVIDKAYQDWDKKLETSRAEKNEELKIKVINEHNSLVNMDSGVESVDNSSLSLTPSPTICGHLSILTPSTSLVMTANIVNNNSNSSNSATLTSIGTSKDIVKFSYKMNKSIPTSHSTTLCDHNNKMISSTYCENNSQICCHLNNSFHAPPVSPKSSLGAQKCCGRSNDPMSRIKCTGHAKSSFVPGYLSNPRLVGSKFQKGCYCSPSDKQYKRLYRICLNVFNKNSLKGIGYLIHFKFIESKPDVVANFLMTRKGVSKSGIGDYLGQMRDTLAKDTLKYFVRMVDMKNKDIDIGLRHLLSFFQIPGESQKIACILEEFKNAYIEQNPDYCARIFKHRDTVMVLAYAIIMLHTDLHNPNIRVNNKMSKDSFVHNLRDIDAGGPLDKSLLISIFDRIEETEMKTLSDHTDQVRKIDQLFIGELRPRNFVQSHRRVVCYCRLYEVMDSNKRDRIGAHQREVFLFNDILVVTKSVRKRKKDGIMYQCRNVVTLNKVEVYLFETAYYPCGIQLIKDNVIVATFNTISLSHRQLFVEDLVEAVEEVSEMDRLRIDEELMKQQRTVKSNADSSSEVTLRKHNCGHNCDQSSRKKEKLSDCSFKKRDIPKSNHRRSASSGGHMKKCISANSSPDKKSNPDIDQSNVYNEENRISGDSGLQEDLE